MCENGYSVGEVLDAAQSCNSRMNRFFSDSLRVTLTVVVLAGLYGCATFTPAPEFFDEELELYFTRGVPEEKPLPPLRTEGLAPHEVPVVRVWRERHRAVVNITTLSAWRSRLFGTIPASGIGSGFIIDGRGLVVTNHHVIAGAQRVVLSMYDGSLYPAQVIGTDPEMDLAVLRFDPQGRELTTIPLADSSRLQVGQQVIALGNPFGLEGTLTAGVVSALQRPVQLRSGFIIRDLVQSDAAINPGNSGGPLLNTRGELVGVNSMMVSPAAGSVGISLSIPSNTTRRIVTHILSEGRVSRGWIEIEGIALNRRLAEAAGASGQQGILITRVVSGGNAEVAGLRDGRNGRVIRDGNHRVPVEGDILLAVNDEPVGSVAELFATLEATRPGEQARLTYLRGDQRRQVTVLLGERPRE